MLLNILKCIGWVVPHNKRLGCSSVHCAAVENPGVQTRVMYTCEINRVNVSVCVLKKGPWRCELDFSDGRKKPSPEGWRELLISWSLVRNIAGLVLEALFCLNSALCSDNSFIL